MLWTRGNQWALCFFLALHTAWPSRLNWTILGVLTFSNFKVVTFQVGPSKFNSEDLAEARERFAVYLGEDTRSYYDSHDDFDYELENHHESDPYDEYDYDNFGRLIWFWIILFGQKFTKADLPQNSIFLYLKSHLHAGASVSRGREWGIAMH